MSGAGGRSLSPMDSEEDEMDVDDHEMEDQELQYSDSALSEEDDEDSMQDLPVLSKPSAQQPVRLCCDQLLSGPGESRRAWF